MDGSKERVTMANEKIYDRINEQSPWQDITEGNKIFEAATSKDFCTGEWRTATPEWSQEIGRAHV